METNELKNLILESSNLINSLGFGLHISSKNGSGYEFNQINEYQIGDDIRYISPIQSAKHQKPMIKLFNEQSNLDTIIISFVSGSLYFGTDEFKSEKLAKIATCFALLANNNSDTFSSYIATTNLLQTTPRSKKKSMVYSVGDELLKMSYLGSFIDFTKVCKMITKIAKKESVIILLGDFLQDNIDLSLLAPYDVRVCIIRDHFEESPQINGNINLIDNFSFEYFYTNISSPQTKNYEFWIQEHDVKLYNYLRSLGFKYTKFYTNESNILPIKEII